MAYINFNTISCSFLSRAASNRVNMVFSRLELDFISKLCPRRWLCNISADRVTNKKWCNPWCKQQVYRFMAIT